MNNLITGGNQECPPTVRNANETLREDKRYTFTCYDGFETGNELQTQTIDCGNKDWTYSHCQGNVSMLMEIWGDQDLLLPPGQDWNNCLV